MKKLLLITFVLSMFLLVGCQEEKQDLSYEVEYGNWNCGDLIDVELDDWDINKYHEIKYPEEFNFGFIREQGRYIIDWELLKELSEKKDLPIICEKIRTRYDSLLDFSCVIGEEMQIDQRHDSPYNLEILCCMSQYCSEYREGAFYTIFSNKTCTCEGW